ncbi:MAG TPA: prepilin-type N-terminal cleavage/methylation domain-containing protein [Bacillota bacterium]|nr:prepilin-type N-terminal cleavage/methylation domain-containing protein [Bacillota bacterium]
MMTRIRQMSQEKGFTLIELLIVIVILGILAAVGIPKFMSNKKDAWAKTCRANRATLDDAAERYNFDNGGYPGSGGTAAVGVFQDALKTGNYIKDIFVCPATDTNQYSLASSMTVCAKVTDNTHAAK